MFDPADPPIPRFGRFFLPGPTEVRREVLDAQRQAMIGHRGPDVRGLMAELQEGLKELFQTDRPVYVSTSSATGLMEAALRNGVRSRVLCLVNGAFSERFARIGRACGLEVDVLEVPWGEANDPEALEERLSGEAYDAVTVVHSETSTGVLNPVDEVAAVCHEHAETLLLVDSVSGLGGAPVFTDAWKVDFLLTGSQKALALPPGLAFAAASGAMLERSASVTGKGVYFDLGAFESQMEKLQTPHTPALTLMYALRAQLRAIRAEGLENRWSRHRRMAEITWEWVERMSGEKGVGLSVLAPPGRRSPTVTCIRLPGPRTGPEVVRALAERGFVIGTGYGRLEEESVRIGHMGDHTVMELAALLEELEEVLLS